MLKIESKQNSWVVETRKLREKKYRDQQNLYWIEGIHLLNEVLKSDGKIVTVVVTSLGLLNPEVKELLKRCNDRGIQLFEISESVGKHLFETETPQGVGATIEKIKREIIASSFLSGTFLLLDRVQDPGNVGTLIRSAEAAGAIGVALTSGCADPWSGKVLRASMGSVFRVPLFTDFKSVQLEEMKWAGWKVYGTAAEGSRDYRDVDFSKQCVLILGSEGKGISAELTGGIDESLKIPMCQPVESLNVAVAGSILLFEMASQPL